MTENNLNIHQRMHLVMKDVAYIQKERTNKIAYSYAKHDTVTAKCREAFIEHRIDTNIIITESKVDTFRAIKWNTYDKCNQEYDVYRADVVMDIEFINIDNPDDRKITKGWRGFGLDTQDKAIGKACSYAYKYALLKTCNLETGDDPEQDNEDHVAVQPITDPKDIAERLISAVNSKKTKEAFDAWQFNAQVIDAVNSIEQHNKELYASVKGAITNKGMQFDGV